MNQTNLMEFEKEVIAMIERTSIATALADHKYAIYFELKKRHNAWLQKYKRKLATTKFADFEQGRWQFKADMRSFCAFISLVKNDFERISSDCATTNRIIVMPKTNVEWFARLVQEVSGIELTNKQKQEVLDLFQENNARANCNWLQKFGKKDSSAVEKERQKKIKEAIEIKHWLQFATPRNILHLAGNEGLYSAKCRLMASQLKGS